MTPSKSAAALAAIAALLAAAEAEAHAKLVSSTPAEGAEVAAPKQIVLKFSEKLQPKFSTAKLARDGAETPAKASVAEDRTTMTVTPAKPLAAGAYKLHWQAVTADTHKIQGDVAFTVR